MNSLMYGWEWSPLRFATTASAAQVLLASHDKQNQPQVNILFFLEVLEIIVNFS